jgi:hypothetical protein
MRLSHLLCLAATALAAIAPFAAAVPARADTYDIVALMSDDGYFFYGMDDSGDVIFDNALGHPGSTSCEFNTWFYSFSNGIFTRVSFAAPVLDWDYNAITCDVPPCSVTDNGTTASESFESDLLTEDLDVTSGSNPPQLLLRTRGFTGDLVINGTGDIVFDNGLADEWYEAVDLSTLQTLPNLPACCRWLPGCLLRSHWFLAGGNSFVPRGPMLIEHPWSGPPAGSPRQLLGPHKVIGKAVVAHS